MNSIIKVSIENEEIPILILRTRSNKSRYTRLMSALIQRLTPNQMNSLIVRYNSKPIILFDNLKLCFEFKGPIETEKKCFCICGKLIKYEHLIVNKETKQEYIIGSTCIDQWTKLDPRYYTDFQRKTLLRTVFNILLEPYNKIPKLAFGKYKGKTLKTVAKKDEKYCQWIVLNPKFSLKLKMDILDVMDISEVKRAKVKKHQLTQICVDNRLEPNDC
jgi:hypothetical protein